MTDDILNFATLGAQLVRDRIQRKRNELTLGRKRLCREEEDRPATLPSRFSSPGSDERNAFIVSAMERLEATEEWHRLLDKAMRLAPHYSQDPLEMALGMIYDRAPHSIETDDALLKVVSIMLTGMECGKRVNGPGNRERYR